MLRMSLVREAKSCPQCGKNLSVMKVRSRVESEGKVFCSQLCVDLFGENREKEVFLEQRKKKRS
jgi:MYM-type Zinc finger with FCS sequence motif.